MLYHLELCLSAVRHMWYKTVLVWICRANIIVKLPNFTCQSRGRCVGSATALPPQEKITFFRSNISPRAPTLSGPGPGLEEVLYFIMTLSEYVTAQSLQSIVTGKAGHMAKDEIHRYDNSLYKHTTQPQCLCLDISHWPEWKLLSEGARRL